MSRAARLGAFIVATLAILAAGIFIVGGKRYLFSSTYQLKTQFGNVAGLAAGDDVRVGGVHSGTVRDIVLPHRPGEKITVVMDLGKSTHEVVKRDSVASIETEGMVGSQYLAISFGSAGAADVQGGDTIVGLPPLEMAVLFKKASDILDSSQQSAQYATQATANLASISAKIDGGQGTVGALVNDKQLYNNLQQTTSALHDTMVHAQEGVADFQENMEALKHNFLLRGYFKNRGYEDSADLAKNEIERLPQGAPMKEFTFPAKQLFDKHDTAELKNQKSLNGGGGFLASNQFGFAVVVASAGMQGDSQKDLALTQARAMVVRDYLVETFEFDDSQLKTLGTGKQPDAALSGGWGTVQILIYPVGTEIPPNKETHAGISSTAVSNPAVPAPAAITPKPRL
jgi:phospholipid/cholesterol/gamma-HCH transport system substrate-binding protein